MQFLVDGTKILISSTNFATVLLFEFESGVGAVA